MPWKSANFLSVFYLLPVVDLPSLALQWETDFLYAVGGEWMLYHDAVAWAHNGQCVPLAVADGKAAGAHSRVCVGNRPWGLVEPTETGLVLRCPHGSRGWRCSPPADPCCWASGVGGKGCCKPSE